MKALLYKDLWIAKRFSLPMLVLAVAICVIPLPFPFDTSALPLVYECLLLPCLFRQEHQEHWYALAAMLPYSSRTLVGSKYFLTGGVILLLGLASFFGPLVTCPGLSAAERLASTGTLVLSLLMFYTFSLPALFFLGPGHIGGAYLVGIAGFGCVGLLSLSFEETHAFFFGQHFPLVLTLTLLLFLASFLVAVRWYGKRQW